MVIYNNAMAVMQHDIVTREVMECVLCGKSSDILYSGLKDRMFNIPGEWNVRQCSNRECGLLWLDPMPIEEDIIKVYENYYLSTGTECKNDSRYATRRVAMIPAHILMRLMEYASGLKKMQERISSMYLSDRMPGRVLDIGCGDGHFLHSIRNKGWQVEGLDTNPDAVKLAATQYGLNVHLSNLENMRYDDCIFDAITISHVIEHVHNPVALLNEACRILKKEGLLIVVTPNAAGYGHKKFADNWMPLDPPRHLFLFNPGCLLHCAQSSGFEEILVHSVPTNALAHLSASYEISVYGRRLLGQRPAIGILFKSIMLQYLELFMKWIGKEVGEELVMLAKK